MNYKKIYTIISLMVIVILLYIIITIKHNSKDTTTDVVSPIKKENVIKEHTIDSITKYNNTVINNIKHIDNIKNEEIKHAKTLNNDSTVILFYKLINE